MFNKKKNVVLPDTEKLNWLRLFRTEGIGPITFYKLIDRFGSAGAALDALPEMAARGGRKKPLRAPAPSVIEREYEGLAALGGDILTAACEYYPDHLRACEDAPPVLSYMGNPALLSRSCIAMVGARNASINGRKLAEKLAYDLGARGQAVASGLARGIDTAAHKGAIGSGTIAVVAGGIDDIYPPENAGLYEEIKARGLILAESPLGQKPFAQSFPKRNRIVSGISRATIVVEATQRSGSLITARLAGEQGREVMAVPGSPLDPRASGPNHLIREGANLVRHADDVLEILMSFEGSGFREPPPAPANFEMPVAGDDELPENGHEIILDQLSFTPVSVDELIRACHMSIPVLQTLLLELEIAGRVKRLAGNRISLLKME
ncbi:MAG: DNA-processing protein DprA [Alphaproteobacteria bacterium]